jgi:uncharacterized protein YqjF (DUF2071 family)
MLETNTSLDRLAMRARPETPPIMFQNWENLLFMHWSFDPAVVRPLVPAELELDLFENRAWISITPFAMTGVRLNLLPAIPGLDSFLELNVRTYVYYRGKPGIYFFSLDASKVIPTVAARIFFELPYFKADMQFTEVNGEFQFNSKRIDSPAQFSAQWKTGRRLRDPHADSLAFFLVERYAFFVNVAKEIRMVRVYHHPWILDEAIVISHRSTMISSLGLSEPIEPPLTHFSRFLNVEAWEPQPV